MPAAKMYGISRAARSPDPDLAPLVEQLDSDDAAVRTFAIETLHHLTGETFGYRQDDPAWVRCRAVERWVEYVRQQECPGRDTPDAHLGADPHRGADPLRGADHG